MTNAETKEYGVDERLRELAEAALMAYSETQPDEATRMARMIAPISELAELLERRASDKLSEAVVVKPLEWVNHGDWTFTAKSPFGPLKVYENRGQWFVDGLGSGHGPHADFDIAMKAAYEDRILSTLTTQPAESAKSGDGVTITDEMVERAARAMEPMAFREEFTATDEMYDFEQEGRAQALGRARAALVAALGDHRA